MFRGEMAAWAATEIRWIGICPVAAGRESGKNDCRPCLARVWRRGEPRDLRGDMHATARERAARRAGKAPALQQTNENTRGTACSDTDLSGAGEEKGGISGLVEKRAKRVGMPKAWAGTIGLTGTTRRARPICAATSSRAWRKARAARQPRQLSRGHPHRGQGEYGEHYDAVPIATCEAALWTSWTCLRRRRWRAAATTTHSLRRALRSTASTGGYGRPFRRIQGPVLRRRISAGSSACWAAGSAISTSSSRPSRARATRLTASSPSSFRC